MRSSLAAFAGLLLVYGEKSCKKSVRFSYAKQSNTQIEPSLHRPGGDEVQDREIMDILRQNPESSVRVLMELYARLIYTVVRSRLPGDMFCAADVEDCVADTFDEFYLGRDKYDPEKGSIRSWLCVIARNKALGLLRRRYRESNVVPLNGELAGEAQLESDLEEQELRKVMLAAVKELKEPDREIVLRKFYLGESSREIAARLNLTVANVDTRTHRAIKRLQKKLKEWR